MAGALIGALRVSLSAETSAFEAGMKRAQRTAQSTASKIKSSFGSIGGEFGLLKSGIAGFVGALSVGTVLAAAKAGLEYAGSLGEIAQQLGVTTRDLQNFRYAASQVGISQEEIDNGLGKLTVTLGRVAAGSKAPIAALKAIGVSVDELKGKDTGEAFRIIADGLEKVQDRSQRAAVEVALFGKTGAKLDNLLAGGSKSINELADANERLGGVLSDAQIQNADKTADKLEDVKRVLQAQIAGVVADNASAILGLANAIAQVAREASAAIGALSRFYDQARIAEKQAEIWLSKRFDAGLLGQLGIGNQTRAANRAGAQAEIDAIRRGQTEARFSAMFRGRPKTSGTGGGNIGQFLAGGGGGGRRGGRDRSAEEAERKRLEALREQNQFDQEIRRAKIDVLQATRDLASDAVERYALSIQIKDAEKAAFEADLQYQVAAKEKTQVQADQLRLEYDKKDQLERDKLIAEESARAREESAKLDQIDFDNQREALELESSMAETASEQRDVQLRLLDLWYRQEKAKLDAIMAEEEVGSLAWEEARRRRVALDAQQGARQQAVKQGTRGPLEDYMSQLPTTTEKWNEALENVAAQGLKSVEDGIVDVLTGAKSVGEALQDILGDIIQQLIRIGIQKMIVMAVGGGFATGGYVSGPGTATSDSIPAMLSNGEFVMNSTSVRNFGVPFFNAINTGQLTPQMLAGGQGGGKGGGGFLEGAAGMGLFGAAGLLATGKSIPIFGVLGKILGFSEGGYAGGGLSIPRASMGSRASVSNDNGAMRGGDTFHFSFPGVTNAREARQSALQAANVFHRAVGRSVKVNG